MVNESIINNESDCHVPPVNKKLWIIEFETRDNSRGCAVVKAANPNEASRVLKSEGLYNGNPEDYMINRIEEIISSPDTMLICEQVVDLSLT